MKIYIRSSWDAVRNKHIKEDYFLTRKSHKPNFYKVEVESYPILKDANGYMHEYPKAPYSVWEASSLDEAADMVRYFIREKNLGGSEYSGGTVYDWEGNKVAKISYNGKIELMEDK